MSSRMKKLPDPLIYKIRSWGLPREVLLQFYRFLLSKVDEFPLTDRTTVKSYEFSATCRDSGLLYLFVGRIAGREYKGEFTFTDIDFEMITRDEPPLY
ncbi:MAG TPA: hypothetical protein VIK18_03910 [Pirellulales bacterium]